MLPTGDLLRLFQRLVELDEMLDGGAFFGIGDLTDRDKNQLGAGQQQSFSLRAIAPGDLNRAETITN